MTQLEIQHLQVKHGAGSSRQWSAEKSHHFLEEHLTSSAGELHMGQEDPWHMEKVLQRP